MNIPKEVSNILIKEQMSYEEIRQILLNATKEVEQEIWEIDSNLLTFPIELNDNELHELIDYFFQTEYDDGVIVNMYRCENIITVECSHGPVPLLTVFAFIIVIIAVILLIIAFK
jgi:hypothetical protein